MWKNYLKSAVRVIIMLPAIILDLVGCFISLLWIITRVIVLAIGKWLCKVIPLSKDCSYAVSFNESIAMIKKAHQTVFVDILDLFA